MKSRLSFTVIELVFVIVIIGILSAVILRNRSDSSIYQARDQIISHIQHAQYLALMNDRFLPNKEFVESGASDAYKEAMVKDWRNSMWRFQIHNLKTSASSEYAGVTYSVYSDYPTNSGEWKNQPQGHSLIARDPINNKCLSYMNKNNLPATCKENRDKRLRLGKVFRIKSMHVFSECGNNKTSETIFFDQMGIPYCGSTKNGGKPKKLTREAKIVIANTDSKVIALCIAPQTGKITHSESAVPCVP